MMNNTQPETFEHKRKITGTVQSKTKNKKNPTNPLFYSTGFQEMCFKEYFIISLLTLGGKKVNSGTEFNNI